MAAGKRPVPFRTRKLSPPAPMVLPPGGSGRVGYRRPNNFTHSTRHTTVRVAGAFRRMPTPLTAGYGVAYAGIRIADNTTHTHHWFAPTDCTNQHSTPTAATPTWANAAASSIRAQPVPRMTSSSPPYAYRLTHCGQQQRHPLLVRTHEPTSCAQGPRKT